MLTSVITAIHLIAAIGVVVLVLLQQGKGASMGAAFGGGGSSASLFGSRGSANFLSRTTSMLATVFFITGLSLAYIYVDQSGFTSATQSNSTGQPIQRSGTLPDIPGEEVSSEQTDAPAIPDAPAE